MFNREFDGKGYYWICFLNYYIFDDFNYCQQVVFKMSFLDRSFLWVK